MKKKNILLYIVFSLILPFLFVCNAKADYKAIVINPATASCPYYNGFLINTGYCFYSNTNLISLVDGVYWLDTGDEVTVYESVATVPTNDEGKCKDYYVYAGYYSTALNRVAKGYYCNDNLSKADEIDEEIKSKFPESYWFKLTALKKAHPNWSFVPVNTGLDFDVAVTNETYGDNSLIQGSVSNNYGYLSLNSNSFDYKQNKFIAYDGIGSYDPWYLANYNTIAYYMDPRNFLSDMYIFQFQTLSYDSSISDENLTNSIGVIFKNDYLNNYVADFVEAGKTSLVNPIYLASLSRQEVGNGSEPGAAINGSYNGMYNFYNIGANSGENPVINGLNYASGEDAVSLRPWDTPNKAIVGGAIWIYNQYVKPGQVTSYFKKYNVVYNYLISIGTTPTFSNYQHQYMQNIKAPSEEADTTYRSYHKAGILDLSYTFYIPVYNNMPEETKLPTKNGWPNNYLKKLIINGIEVPEFDGEVENYNYELDINNPVIEINAEPVASNARIVGKGTYTLDEDTTKEIVVTAQNGDVKKYKINIKLVGTKLVPPTDVVSTLNNAGIKNGNKYISGLIAGSNIKIIKDKILIANKDAIVELKNSNDELKEDGVVATGDKIIITVGEETKTYEVVIYGDISGDGVINNIDFIRLKKNLLNTLALSGPYREAADISKEGTVNNIDFIRLKKYLLGDTTIIVQ